MGQTISKTLAVNRARNFLIMLNNLQHMHFKLLQKDQFKKQQKQLVIWLAIKMLAKLQKRQKHRNFLEVVLSKTDIPRERYITQKKREQISDKLRLIK